MRAIQTVNDKTEALKQRQREQRELGKRIDRLINDGHNSMEGDALGCGGRGMCPTIGRFAARMLGLGPRHVVATSDVEMEVSMEDGAATACSSRVQASAGHRLFGMSVAKQTPAAKLEAVGATLKRRVETLQIRIDQHRQAAAVNMKAGRKEAALRELKKAKVCEKHAISAQGVMDAMEQQNDMMVQTALQREVVDALGATSKTMKNEKKLLSKVEDAVDTASELKDLHEDVAHVMEGLTNGINNDVDDEDLMSELQSMMTDTAPKHDPISDAVSDDMVNEAIAIDKAKHDLERKHQELEESNRASAGLPAAPTRLIKKLERQSLLQE